jgi:hypothetical protein
MGAVGLTQLIGIEMRCGEAGLYSPVEHAGAAVGRCRSDGPFHVAFLAAAYQPLWPLRSDEPSESSLLFSLPHLPLAALHLEAGRAVDIIPGASHLGSPRSMSG